MLSFKEILLEEASAIAKAAENIDSKQIESAINLLRLCSENNGKLITSGVGKSGIVARKIAATFSSIGLMSIFLSPVDALHGDIGIVAKNDLCILLTNSGETTEIIDLITHLKLRGVQCISILSNSNSTIALQSDVVLEGIIDKEVCPLNLAPTASTSVAMAIGDALAVSWMDLKGITSLDFAVNHPAGSLGRKLTMTVGDLMIPKKSLHPVFERSSINTIISNITKDGIGSCFVFKDQKAIEMDSKLMGLITDGDLRRALKDTNVKDWDKLTAKDIMTENPITVNQKYLASEAMILMEQNKNKTISVLPIVSDSNSILGLLRLHDLVQAGL